MDGDSLVYCRRVHRDRDARGMMPAVRTFPVEVVWGGRDGVRPWQYRSRRHLHPQADFGSHPAHWTAGLIWRRVSALGRATSVKH